jgi:hypothetical protein
MGSIRGALQALAAAAAFAAAACSSSSGGLYSIDTYPQGATVLIGGQEAEPTPVSHKNIVIPSGGSVMLILKKDGYQTVAVPITERSPARLFFCLESLPDVEALRHDLKALSDRLEEIGASVQKIQTELSRKGGN